jgi:hypothetical protein
MDAFGEEILKISRRVLGESLVPIGYFDSDHYGRTEALWFAIDVLWHSDDSRDLATLRAKVGDSLLARGALSAIQTIEMREAG